MAIHGLLAAICIFGSATAAVLKDGVEIGYYSEEACHRSSPEHDKCLTRSIEMVLHRLANEGIKEIQMPPLDPMNVPEVLMNFGGAGYTFKALLRDSSTHGLSKIKVLAVRTDFKDRDNMNLELDYYLPKVFSEGKYKIDGVIADFPINGKGIFNISMVDVQATFKLNGYLVEEDGETYLRVHRIFLRPDVGNMNIYFSNLVNGNPELSSIALTFFNQFWKVIYPEILPYAEEGFDKILRGFLNQAFLKIPYDQLFPL